MGVRGILEGPPPDPSGLVGAAKAATVGAIEALEVADGECERLDQGRPVAPGGGELESWNYINLAAYVLNVVITYASLTGIFGETNTDLSRKYQTLVTPAGWAFSIWGPLFIWEGVFAVCQMLPTFRGNKVVQLASPWWWGACVCQCAWTFAFAQEVIPLSLLLMLSILACLTGLLVNTDGLKITWAEYLCLRAPFCLHLGWIICASAVNTNVQFDAARTNPETLLAVAVLSFVAIMLVNTILVITAENPGAIPPLVAAWAFAAVASELGKGENLQSPDRHNPHAWPGLVLDGLRSAATGAAWGAVVLAAAALALSAARGWQRSKRDAA